MMNPEITINVSAIRKQASTTRANLTNPDSLLAFSEKKIR